MDDFHDERKEELSSITAIYPELIVEGQSASLDLPVTPATPLLVRFVPQQPSTNVASHGEGAQPIANAHVEHDVQLSHLPSLKVMIELPDGYPSEQPPVASLATDHDWLPTVKLNALEQQLAVLWEDYGRCQVLYDYIDYLQQAAGQGFDVDQSPEGCLTLPVTLEQPLVEFDKSTKLSIFKQGSYYCGVCLDQKEGAVCYKLEHCGHVFCRECLLSGYNKAIQEGDVTQVTCPGADCGKDSSGVRQRKVQRPLHPTELLAMGVDEPTARRYVELKRKKLIDSDKNTVYCPRDHCKHPARNPTKYPLIPDDLADYTEPDESDESSNEAGSHATYDPNDRLAICENPKCKYAFCRTCYKSWHGELERCRPRDPTELSVEEKATYDYMAQNTTPCPSCRAAISKLEGCNHMNCTNCKTHFCYICSAWLSPDNPYQHFNTAGSECYQRLFDMADGDNGQENAFLGARHWEQMARAPEREADWPDPGEFGERLRLGDVEEAPLNQRIRAAELRDREAELRDREARQRDREARLRDREIELLQREADLANMRAEIARRRYEAAMAQIAALENEDMVG